VEKLVQSCMNYALKLLGKKSYSIHGITCKLILRYPEDICDLVIEKCKSYNYLDDQKFIEFFIHDKQLFNKWGINKIKIELQRHKLTLNTEIYNFDLEEKNATYLILKKDKMLKLGLSINERKYKITNFLLQKGYEYALVNRLTATVINNHEL
jgi:SOS response regulatory protein OraA/RecX